MADTQESILGTLRGLGTPEEMLALAEKGYAPRRRESTNAHIHLPPNFSAFESVAQAVELAADQGVRVLGTSNYYDFTVYADFAGLARKRGVFPLFGLEIIALLDDFLQAGTLVNDPGNPGRMYLCGKGIMRFGAMTAGAQELMQLIRRSDTRRMREMIARMEEIFAARGVATGLSEEALIERLVRKFGVRREAVCLQERHIAEGFQEAFFMLVPPAERPEKLSRIFGTPSQAGPEESVKAQQEIRTHLMKVGKPAFVPEKFVNFEQAYRLVLELGGIPCYPTLADGASPICAYEDPPEKLIQALAGAKIYSAEFIPIRNVPEVLGRYVRSMRSAGLVITGGTEHNTQSLIPLTPECLKRVPLPEDIREIFWEGACVLAAHQFLTLHGACGYVDVTGALHPGFADVEARIAHFRKLGAAVIARYYQRYADKE